MHSISSALSTTLGASGMYGMSFTCTLQVLLCYLICIKAALVQERKICLIDSLNDHHGDDEITIADDINWIWYSYMYYYDIQVNYCL